MKLKILASATCLVISNLSYADICKKIDDRIPSADKKVGKLVKTGEKGGCGITLISKNCAVTIGQCAEDRDYAEFNAPQSINGQIQSVADIDRYEIDQSFIKYKIGGIGSNWAVIKLKENAHTGKAAGEVQGFYKIISKKPQTHDPIKVIQYSYALSDASYVREGDSLPNPLGEILHFAQSEASGELIKAGIFLIPDILEYDADTSYGAWGAPIINRETNELIGINTHGGCNAKYPVKLGARYTNAGTSIWGSSAFKKAIISCISSDK